MKWTIKWAVLFRETRAKLKLLLIVGVKFLVSAFIDKISMTNRWTDIQSEFSCDFFFKFQKRIALRQTEQPIRIFGTSYSACYNHENQADRQLCHTFSKPCSEVKWFIWNILPQLRLKLLLHTFQCIAMQWLCIIFYHSVLLQIQEKRNWDYKPLCIQNCRAPLLLLCLWLRNEHGTGEDERQRCLSPVCL